MPCARLDQPITGNRTIIETAKGGRSSTKLLEHIEETEAVQTAVFLFALKWIELDTYCVCIPGLRRYFVKYAAHRTVQEHLVPGTP